MGFEDLGDLSELDEMPPFEEELTLPDFDDDSGGGVSRTFKIIGALLVLLVVGIVAVAVWWALGNSDEPSPNEMTSTRIVAMNATTFADATLTQEAHQATQTANAIAVVASQEAIATFEFYQTQTQSAAWAQETQTQEAAWAQGTHTQEAANAAATQTQEAADAAATQTQEAVSRQQTQAAIDAAATATRIAQLNLDAQSLTQTQVAIDANLTATAAAARSFSGELVDETGNIFGGVTLRLYRDDGDGIFNPALDTVQNPPASTPEPGTPQTLLYGDAVDKTLQRNTVDLWRFEGSQGDIVTIEATAGNPASMDMYLALLGPNEQPLTEDDDSGPELDAKISDYRLPEDGVYTIRVSSVSDPGPYTLRLEGVTAGGEGQSALPRAAHPSGIVLVQLGGPSPTPIPGGGDTFITFTETDLEGAFAFEDLDPGIYWLVVDYDTLPESIKGLIPRTDELVIMVNVPVTGRVTFTIGVPPTATPDMAIFLTQTKLAPTVTPEVAGTETPTTGPDLTATLQQSGLLSDFGQGSGLEGGSGLTVLAIAAAGLIAMVFIARRLRTAA